MATEQEIAKLVIRLEAQTGELKTQLKQAEGSVQNFVKQAKSLLGTIGIGIGVGVLVDQFKELLKWSIAINAEEEKEVHTMASLISASSSITDQTGKQLEGQERFNAALGEAERIHRDIEMLAISVGEKSEDLIDGWQRIAAVGSQAGASYEDILKISKGLVGAMQAMNMPMRGMRAEAEGLFAAEKGQETYVMRRLGIEGEVAAKMREEGTLVDYLKEKFAAYEEASRRNLDTWKGLTNAIQGAIEELGEEATKPFFKTAEESLRVTLSLLVENKDGVTKFTDQAQKAADSISQAFATIGKTLTVLAKHFESYRYLYGTIFTALLETLRTLNIVIGTFFLGLMGLLDGFQSMALVILHVWDVMTFGKVPMLRNAIKQVEEDQKRLIKNMADTASILSGEWFPEKEETSGVKFRPGQEERAVEIQNKLKATAKQTVIAGEAVDKFNKKAADMGIEMTNLKNPVQASRLALEAFIAESTKGVNVNTLSAEKAKELANAQNTLRASFEALQKAQETKAVVEARDKAALTVVTESTETSLLNLEESYRKGEVGLEEYFNRRRAIITAGARNEIAIMRTQLGRIPTEGPESAERISLAAEITAKEETLARTIITVNKEEEESYKRLFEVIRAGNLGEEAAKVDLELQRVENRYRHGLVTIEQYYNEKRRLEKESSDALIAALENEQSAEKDEIKVLQLEYEIRKERAKQIQRDEQITNDLTDALANQVTKIYELKTAMAGLKFEAMPEAEAIKPAVIPSPTPEGTLAAPLYETPLGTATQGQQSAYEADLAAFDLMQQQKLESLQSSLTDQEAEQMGYVEREAALYDISAQQMRARQQFILQQNKSLFASQLEMAGAVASTMSDVFGAAYEMSGQKAKAFFYMQKAMAVAEVLINTAIAVSRLPRDMPAFLGIPMASMLWGMAAANIGIITAQTITAATMEKGGLIKEGSGTKDDVPILATRHEFIQPKRVVEYYGVEVMEALRRMLIPREELTPFAVGRPRAPESGRYELGGTIEAAAAGHTINVPVNVSGNDIRLATALQDNIRETVIRTLREFS